MNRFSKLIFRLTRSTNYVIITFSKNIGTFARSYYVHLISAKYVEKLSMSFHRSDTEGIIFERIVQDITADETRSLSLRSERALSVFVIILLFAHSHTFVVIYYRTINTVLPYVS